MTVHEGIEVNGTSLALTLSPARLVVHPTASPASGAAPLTVTFQANVAGGTGTYRSLVWSFGTGDQGSGLSVPYTFVAPGHYLVTVNATDSAGATAAGSVYVNVTGTGASAPASNEPLEWAMVVLGATIGAGAGAVAMFLWHRREGRRRRAAAAPPKPPAAPAPTAPEERPGAGPAPGGAAVAPPTPAGEVRSRPASPEAFRISQRIVLHLAAQGVLGPQEVASIEFTQPGISRSVGVRQNALTNVLRRLVAAGVLVEDVRHVRGQPRRLKVYQLTPRGEALARDLRLQRSRSTGA